MSPRPAIDITTIVRRPADELWNIVTTPTGVNAELMPLVRMTFPTSDLTIADAPLDEPFFVSWLLLFGFLPFDRHVLIIHKTGPLFFVEQSHSLMQKLWSHERYLSDAEGGTAVRDVVTVIPRLTFLSTLTNAIVAMIFRHRHRRLAGHYNAN